MEKYFALLHTKTDHVLKHRKYKFCDVYLYIRKFLMFNVYMVILDVYIVI